MLTELSAFPIDLKASHDYGAPPYKPTIAQKIALAQLQSFVQNHPSHDARDDAPLFDLMGKVGSKSKVKTHLTDLPEEIQQIILDVILGGLKSVSEQKNGTRNWSNAMRHPRARELSNLALVTPPWRRMVQERLYRHSEFS